MQRAWRGRSGAAVPLFAALVSVTYALLAPDPGRLTWAGTLASAALAWAAFRSPNGELLSGQVVPLSISVVLLTICGVGLDQSNAMQSWRSPMAIAAYPFLGHARIQLVAAHRQVREADVFVEAALVGTAVGIVLHVAFSGWQAQVFTTAWGDAGAPTRDARGLDVALLVVGLRGLNTPAARRGVLGVMHVGLVSLFGAHLLQQIEVSRGHGVGGVAGTLALVALLAIGGAAIHPAAAEEPNRTLEQPLLFSATHAGVVVVALLAARGCSRCRRSAASRRPPPSPPHRHERHRPRLLPDRAPKERAADRAPGDPRRPDPPPQPDAPGRPVDRPSATLAATTRPSRCCSSSSTASRTSTTLRPRRR